MTDKGPSYIAGHSISVMYYIFHYIDINSGDSSAIKLDLKKIVGKYVECSKWKDALKIIQIIVTRSSSLAAAPIHHHASTSTLPFSQPSSSTLPFSQPSSSTLPFSQPAPSLPNSSSHLPSSYTLGASIDCLSVASSSSFTDSEFSSRRELPGRTMDFEFDVSQTPIVGRRLINPEEEENEERKKEVQFSLDDEIEEEVSVKSEGTVKKGVSDVFHDEEYKDEGCKDGDLKDEENVTGNWRKPWLSQSRTRDRLISLVSNFSQRVKLPKSPSVMFYRTSEPLGVIESGQPSVASSSEEITVVNNDASEESTLGEATPGAEFALFKDFDFLEYELESQESESMDNFNWGVRRRSITNLEDTVDDLFSGSPCREEPIDASCSSQGGNQDMSSDEDPESISPFDPATATARMGSKISSSVNPHSSPSIGERKRPHSVLSCSSIRSERDREPSLSASNTPFSSSPP